MLSLIRFEFDKIIQKKLILATLLGMAFLTFIMVYNWVSPGYSRVVTEENGTLITYTNREAVLLNQEICARFAGPLTNEKVQQILAEYRWSESAIEQDARELNRPIYYTHNLMYNAFTSQGFSDENGNYNGTDIQQLYGEIASDLTLGYYTGWEGTLYCVANLLLFWGCAAVIMLSSIFSEEYTRGMDSLILTGAKGRTRCSSAKLIAAFLVSLCGSVLIILSATLALLLYHGTVGFEASIQITDFGFLSNTPYVMSWGSAYGYACLLWISSILVVSAVTLLISAVAKSSFTALVISFVVYMIPLFIPWSAMNLAPLGAFQPVNQVLLTNTFYLDMLQLGDLSFPCMWLALPIAAVVSALCIFLSKKFFAGHQVV